MRVETEVCVVGGGPAGAAIACRLAMLGHDVCLLERAPNSARVVAETVPTGIMSLLELLDARARVEQAGELRRVRTHLRWAEPSLRVKEETGEPGFLVDRGKFDALLRAAARDAGVRSYGPANALRPVRLEQGGWEVPVLGSEATSVRAAFLVDATGRRALLGGRRVRLTAPTLALCGLWCDTGRAFAGLESRLEAGEAAWYWGASLPDDTFQANVFVDPEASAGQEGITERYLRLVRAAELLRGCPGGVPVGRIVARSAGAYRAERAAATDFIRVGDAAMSLDPLSSQGVLMALQSGIQGAIVVHTLRCAPAYADAALEFFERRQADNARRHRAMSAAAYAEVRRFADHPFWRRRAAGGLVGAAHATRQPVKAHIAGATALRLCEEAFLAASPCVMGDLIVPAVALHHPGLEHPVAFLGGVEIAPLLARITGNIGFATLISQWSCSVPLGDALTLARWLVARGVLVIAEESTQTDP